MYWNSYKFTLKLDESSSPDCFSKTKKSLAQNDDSNQNIRPRPKTQQKLTLESRQFMFPLIAGLLEILPELLVLSDNAHSRRRQRERFQRIEAAVCQTTTLVTADVVNLTRRLHPGPHLLGNGTPTDYRYHLASVMSSED